MPLLSTHRLVLLRAALVEYIAEREHRSKVFPAYLQGQPVVVATVRIGREINDARSMLTDVEDLIARTTGAPRILHNNDDLVPATGLEVVVRERVQPAPQEP